jgi:hypothetical protein
MEVKVNLLMGYPFVCGRDLYYFFRLADDLLKTDNLFTQRKDDGIERITL